VVRPQNIRVADKAVTDWGKWQTGGMPASAFPLSRRRGRSYRLGSAYRWRLIRFDALGSSFRLLLAFSLEKQQYRATLALDLDRDMSVVASYEFHGTHPGWHVAAACGDIENIPLGVMVGPWQRRIPNARHVHRNVDFTITDDNSALETAAEFFGLHKVEGGLL
jgi:hypothetical protein